MKLLIYLLKIRTVFTKEDALCREMLKSYSLTFIHVSRTLKKIYKINILCTLKNNMVRPRGIEPLFPP